MSEFFALFLNLAILSMIAALNIAFGFLIVIAILRHRSLGVRVVRLAAAVGGMLVFYVSQVALKSFREIFDQVLSFRNPNAEGFGAFSEILTFVFVLGSHAPTALMGLMTGYLVLKAVQKIEPERQGPAGDIAEINMIILFFTALSLFSMKSYSKLFEAGWNLGGVGSDPHLVDNSVFLIATLFQVLKDPYIAEKINHVRESEGRSDANSGSREPTGNKSKENWRKMIWK